jgi:hypothetical protein
MFDRLYNTFVNIVKNKIKTYQILWYTFFLDWDEHEVSVFRG